MKLACDLTLWFCYGVRAIWMKVKLALMAFLTINAFVFLVPMMPELRAMAEEAAVPAGFLPEAFHELEARETLVGISNALPLVLERELILGAFWPRLFGEGRNKGT